MKKHTHQPTCFATHLHQQHSKPGTATRDAYDKTIQAPKLGELLQAMQLKQKTK